MTAIAPGQPCGDCGKPMLPGTHFYRPTPPGLRRHAAHGLCKSCSRGGQVRGYLTGPQRGNYVEPADPVVVHRLVDGQRLPSNPAERREATLLLTRAGWSAAGIARHLGIAQRTVVRYRTRLAVAA